MSTSQRTLSARKGKEAIWKKSELSMNESKAGYGKYSSGKDGQAKGSKQDVGKT